METSDALNPLANSQPGQPGTLSDIIAITKPRVTAMVVTTTGLGVYLGLGGDSGGLLIMHALLGTILVVASANTLNQVWERNTDALMKRTADRPVAAGRISVTLGIIFGIILGIIGLAYLTFLVNKLTAFVGLIALLSYVLAYTPLKRKTWFCTIVGAFPGALPPVMGWTAARETIEGQAIALFLILFFWQLPHFFAIAWMYKEDYDKAGLRMLTVTDETGKNTAAWAIVTCTILIAVSLIPFKIGMVGNYYFIGAILAGGLYLTACVMFARDRTNTTARKLLMASVIYLTAIVLLMLIDASTALGIGNCSIIPPFDCNTVDYL